MKPYLLAFLMLVTFSSCVVRVIEPQPIVTKPAPPPPNVVVFVPGSSLVIINQRLGLPAYPNSRVFNLDNNDRDGSSRSVGFETNASLNQVYGFFHNELLKRGWSLSKLNVKVSATKVEARYQRPNERFDFKLDQQGNSGRYKLEIKF
jgi:hypothetical protein